MGKRRDSVGRGQKPAAAPMGGEVGYGEGAENLTAQNPNEGGIPLPDNRPRNLTNASGEVVAAQTPPPQMAALDAARGYNPNIMPLNAMDDQPELAITAGLMDRVQDPRAIRDKRIQLLVLDLTERIGGSEIGSAQALNAAKRLRAATRSR